MIDKNKKIKGIITDGDLRRAFKNIKMTDKAHTIMKSKPVTASSELLISSAVILMNNNSITSLIIARNEKPIGIVNLKQCIDNE
jgi:arabinose-5-phosphate isomerase